MYWEHPAEHCWFQERENWSCHLASWSLKVPSSVGLTSVVDLLKRLGQPKFLVYCNQSFSIVPDVIWDDSTIRVFCVSVFPDGFSTGCLECCHSSHLCLRSLCNFTLRVRVRVYTLPLITSLLANPMEPQFLLLQPNQPQLYCYSSTCTILCFFACKWN